MASKRISFPVTVAVRSPFTFGAVTAASVGIDRPCLRNAKRQPILPAKHLKGLFREAFRALLACAPAAAGSWSEDELFGQEANTALAPERGRLVFADLAAAASATQTQTRIKIDTDTGTAEDGALQVVELAAPLGETSRFGGEIVWRGDESRANDLQRLLGLALQLIPYFGGLRSLGYGEHVAGDSSIGTAVQSPISRPQPGDETPDAINVTATFDRPIMVDAEQLADNVFRGGSVVPGAAIKAAIAEALALLHGRALTQDENRMLAEISVSHAFPVDSAGTELNHPLPASAVCFPGRHKDEKTYFADALGMAADVACFDPARKQPGLFLHDMKYEKRDDLSKHLSLPATDFPTVAYGHTAIDSRSGSAAKGKLFMVLARDAGQTAFRFAVSFPASSKAVQAHVSGILRAGLDGIGKTQARLTTPSVIFTKTDEGNSSPQVPSRLRILLETPSPLAIPMNGSTRSLHDLIAAYFSNRNESLVLRDLYFTHEIKGGYAVRRLDSKGYAPLRLIKAGSVFEFQASEKAFQALQDIRKRGLPVMQETAGGFTEMSNWREMLYVPENGYGAFSIEPACFSALAALRNGGAS